MTPPASNERLIVALDVPTSAAALRLADSLSGVCRWVKVGLQLFIAAGPGVVTDLKSRGFSVFLDLKLHDIPNTVAGAVQSAAATGADMLTVHASGGPSMLAAAVEAAKSGSQPIRLLAVTVLTSMDASQLASVGITSGPVSQVELLATTASQAGIRDMVCSPQEATSLRRIVGEDPWLVTPGIRGAGSATDDQHRIATPAAAIQAGATHLVVGRQITQAANPKGAAEAIQREIAESLLVHK